MNTAIDTNVLVALWDVDGVLSLRAQQVLEQCQSRGNLVLSPIVFAELLAAPGRSERFVSSFLEDTGIRVDWDIHEGVWRLAGQAFAAYASRRRKQKEGEPRRILADFLIGAHALKSTERLLSLDHRFYRTAFPDLELVKW
jgi:hypothetical protein